MPEGAAVVVLRPGLVGREDLLAALRGIVCALALLAVVVPQVVPVLLVELVVAHRAELPAPEDEGFLERETEALGVSAALGPDNEMDT